MKKKTTQAIEAPLGAERFTISMTPTESEAYTWLSVHVFHDTRYQVVAILKDGDKIAVEFLRLQ